MVPTFSGTRYDLASFQIVSPSESCPRSIVRRGDVTIKNMLFDLCLCVGSVAQRDEASDYESEESRFDHRGGRIHMVRRPRRQRGGRMHYIRRRLQKR